MKTAVLILPTDFTSSHYINITPLIFTPSATSECDIDNGGCDHYCTETINNYTCSCYPGYTLQLDGHTCTGKMVGNEHFSERKTI